jgi:hypothetical protein
MIYLMTGLFIGFLILGPFGALIGLIMGGFLMLRPVRIKERNVIEGHSAGCGCRKCYR